MEVMTGKEASSDINTEMSDLSDQIEPMPIPSAQQRGAGASAYPCDYGQDAADLARKQLAASYEQFAASIYLYEPLASWRGTYIQTSSNITGEEGGSPVDGGGGRRHSTTTGVGYGGLPGGGADRTSSHPRRGGERSSIFAGGGDKNEVIIHVHDLEKLLHALETRSKSGGDKNVKKFIAGLSDFANRMVEKVDPADYTTTLAGLFGVAIALRVSSIASYPVLKKALGPKFARLAYDFPWVLIFILGVGLFVNVAFDKSAKAKIFGKYTLLLAIAIFLGVATWFWISLQIDA